MAPIFKGTGEHGIGYGHADFVEDFARICQSHLSEGRAQSFAMIFYNVHDDRVWEAVNSPDGFRILNQESGANMTVFYLDASGRSLSTKFNRTFMSQLGVWDQVHPPCIVFFRVSDDQVEDVSFARIDGEKEPHIIIEQLRRRIHERSREIRGQGDLSALSPLPLVSLLGVLRRAALGG